MPKRSCLTSELKFGSLDLLVAHGTFGALGRHSARSHLTRSCKNLTPMQRLGHRLEARKATALCFCSSFFLFFSVMAFCTDGIFAAQRTFAVEMVINDRGFGVSDIPSCDQWHFDLCTDVRGHLPQKQKKISTMTSACWPSLPSKNESQPFHHSMEASLTCRMENAERKQLKNNNTGCPSVRIGSSP